MARLTFFIACASWVFSVGCPETRAPSDTVPGGSGRAPTLGAVTTSPVRAALLEPDRDALPEASGLPPGKQALQVVAGKERTVAVAAALAQGLALVDLSDDFVPPILQDGVGKDGSVIPNRYRKVYVGLANDRSDGDGTSLAPGTRNYLEFYGIPPSFSVLRRRFLEDAERSCDGSVNTQVLLAPRGIATFGRDTEKQEASKHTKRGNRLAAARAKAGVASLEALVGADPRYRKDVQDHLRVETERASFHEVEKRLICEGLLDPQKHATGSYDGPMRSAVLAFQQKHRVHAQADLTASTLEALARPLLQNDYLAFERTLTERVVFAGGFLEDGSVAATGLKAAALFGRPTYQRADGQRVAVPNLVADAVTATQRRMGWHTPADVLAFFRRHGEADFQSLRVAVRFPTPPEYYSSHMDLMVRIDRGDVYYDFPFDAKGQRLPQPRDRFPTLNLLVRWRDEWVPLVAWRTTIGGWRAEVAADGQEYFRYKDSDVGKRVWRHIVAAPVWLPPTTTPVASMVKTKFLGGGFPKVVNYDETGPGHLSAYGLVAGIHVEPRQGAESTTYSDNGIRTHGSFDYLSLRGRFSHGCHRLYNHLAVRLFSFLLTHRKRVVDGPLPLNFKRTFYVDGEVFDMRIPTRGYYFELTPPLPVETLLGTIKGVRQSPLADYVPKPGVVYRRISTGQAEDTGDLDLDEPQQPVDREEVEP